MSPLIKLALSMPPHLALGRAYRWFKRALSGWIMVQWRKNFCSYPETSFAESTGRVMTGLRSVPPLPADLISLDHWRARRFNLLGSGWVSVKADHGVTGLITQCWPADRAKVAGLVTLIDDPHYACINWHVDFKSGYRWDPRGHGPSTPYGHRAGVDIKVPWELARMGHLLTMAQFYADQPDATLAKDIRNQILDFWAANPPGWGVNWACTMDVSIRIATILTAYDCLVASGWMPDKAFEQELASLTLAHGRFIRTHLEEGGNHYLANLCGLILAGGYLPHLPEASQWIVFARPLLDEQILVQFNPDGSNYEASTGYHSLSLEMALKTLDVGAPPEVIERLSRAIAFCRDITMPSGRVVQIGDNDSGRFLHFNHGADPLDYSALWRGVELPAMPPPDIPAHAQPQGTARRITKLRFHWPDTKALEDLQSFAYPDFGLFGWRGERCFISFRCGPIGQLGRGGHAHNDQLALEIELDGQPWARDPGSYLYTPDMAARNRYRSALAHFVPRNGDQEPARFLAPFQLEDKAQAKLITMSDRTISGFHVGFDLPVIRHVTLLEDGLLVEDWLGGNKPDDSTQIIEHDIHQPYDLAQLWGLDLPFSPGYGCLS